MAKSRHRSSTLEGNGTERSAPPALQEAISAAVFAAWNRGLAESTLLFEHFEQLAEGLPPAPAEEGAEAGTLAELERREQQERERTLAEVQARLREPLEQGLERVNALEPVVRRPGRKRKYPPQGMEAVLRERVHQDNRPNPTLAGAENPTPEELAEAEARARLGREDRDAAEWQDVREFVIAKNAGNVGEVERIERSRARLEKAKPLAQRKTAGKANGRRAHELAAPRDAQREAEVRRLQAKGLTLFEAAVEVALSEGEATGRDLDESTVRRSVQKVRQAKERTGGK